MSRNVRSESRSSDAAIVICCYTDRRWPYLRQAIAAALAQTAPAAEVVAVVDHNPALAARLRAEGFAGLAVVENTNRPGLSGARNTGIEATRSPLILFLDDDATSDPDLLERLTQRMAEPDVLGVVAAIRPHWEAGRPAWFPDEFLWTLGCTYRGLEPGPVRNLIGAAMCVRRAVFERVGGFDTGFGRTTSSLPLGCEETELCIRAGRALTQGRFVFDPASGCDHAIPAARGTWRYFLRRCWAEGLSKADLAGLAGSGRALASERAYVTKTLPAGILDALSDAVVRLRFAGLSRAAAILAGLGATAAAYGLGRLRRLPSAPQPKPEPAR